MPRIHFLNVKDGDCSIVQHNSGNVTVIDVCNAEPVGVDTPESTRRAVRQFTISVRGNFGQKRYPVNPVKYLGDHNISSIMRFVLTHPDMDHMDGIKALFDIYRPLNFWDTDNSKEFEDSDWENSPYNREDWDFYKNLRDTRPNTDPRRLALLSGSRGKYFNVGEDDSSGGDGIHILAPTQDLVDAANASGDYNDCSYVLLYHSIGDRRIVFSGDSHDGTWEHILDTHKSRVTDIDLLIAPHHGRDSERSYEFLDVLKPKLTFFGNAPSEHLAYDQWDRRGLPIVTNNQANCMIVDESLGVMKFYATHENYAKAANPDSYYDYGIQGWYVCDI